MNEGECTRIVYMRAGLGDHDMRRCEACGAASPLSRQHRVKRSHGGAWTPSNIAVLCGDGTSGCHGRAERYDAQMVAGGWALPSTEDPLAVPVHHYTWGRVWLDDEGGYLLHPPDGVQA